MKEIVRGVQVNANLTINGTNVYYFSNVSSITIDTSKTNYFISPEEIIKNKETIKELLEACRLAEDYMNSLNNEGELADKTWKAIRKAIANAEAK